MEERGDPESAEQVGVEVEHAPEPDRQDGDAHTVSEERGAGAAQCVEGAETGLLVEQAVDDALHDLLGQPAVEHATLVQPLEELLLDEDRLQEGSVGAGRGGGLAAGALEPRNQADPGDLALRQLLREGFSVDRFLDLTGEELHEAFDLALRDRMFETDARESPPDESEHEELEGGEALDADLGADAVQEQVAVLDDDGQLALHVEDLAQGGHELDDRLVEETAVGATALGGLQEDEEAAQQAPKAAGAVPRPEHGGRCSLDRDHLAGMPPPQVPAPVPTCFSTSSISSSGSKGLRK